MKRRHFFLAAYCGAYLMVSAQAASRTPVKACSHLHPWGAPISAQAGENRAEYYCSTIEARFDTVFRTPLWVVQRLTANDVRKFASLAVENRRPMGSVIQKRNEYVGSKLYPLPLAFSGANGFDSRELENIAVPAPMNINEALFASIDQTIVELVKAKGELLVISGPVFQGNPAKLVGGQVSTKEHGIAIPDAIFKIIIDKDSMQSVVFLVPNKVRGTSNNISDYQTTIKHIERLTTFNFNPEVPQKNSHSLEEVRHLLPGRHK